MPKKTRRVPVRHDPIKDRWECKTYINGRRRREYFASEAEAWSRYHELRQQAEVLESPESDPNVTLEEYARNWLQNVAGDLQPKTYSSYEQLLRLHILPSLGHLPIHKITRATVKRFLAAKRDQGYERKERRLAYSKHTLRLLKATLSAILGDATDDGIIKANPCLGMSRRRGKPSVSVKPGKDVRPLSSEERDAFLEAVRGTRHGVLFELMAKTGLRPGEAYALKPEDVDLRRRTLRVERAITTGGRVKPTKTEESRDVEMSPELARLLSEYLPWLREECVRLGLGEPVWLFPSDVNTPLDHNNIAKVFRSVLTGLGIPRHRLYDLRHTYASLLLEAGAPITYVSHQLGHRDVGTTLKFYTRWIPDKSPSFAHLVDRPLTATGTATTAQKGSRAALEESAERFDSEAIGLGEPWRNRTSNLLIKSQLLCQLS